ncbi:hypothetical protein BZZ01_04555 [Nostocales cyanobacterium HT-58-2]|nr:hypothetical protein BZZ01_04555 [Nostocales cyanobacterium HT-58-2]
MTLHHSSYGKHELGENWFPLCKRCHTAIAHSPENWKKDKKNPVWGNRNTAEFTERLKRGYKLLYEGINHEN